MKVNIHPEAKKFVQSQDYGVITVSADRECVGANCSSAFTHVHIGHKVPDEEKLDQYEIFEVDGISVFFDKSIETVPEVTIVKEHHLLKDLLRVDGLPVPPPITHNKL